MEVHDINIGRGGLVVDMRELANLSLKTLESLRKLAEKCYGLVRYTLPVLFLLQVVISNAI